MKRKVFLVDWDAGSAERHAEALRRAGFVVQAETENGGRAYRTIRTSLPDAVVIDLRHRPSHGREVGSALRELKATRALPIVCIEEGEDAREQTRARIDGVRFATEPSLEGSLSDALREARDAVRATARGRTSGTSSSTRR